jgi:hypothetical protein
MDWRLIFGNKLDYYYKLKITRGPLQPASVYGGWKVRTPVRAAPDSSFCTDSHTLLTGPGNIIMPEEPQVAF